MSKILQVQCGVCHKMFLGSRAIPASLVRQAIAEIIALDNPNWNQESFICQDDLNRYRSLYVQSVLTQEKGELTQLEHDVIRSLQEHETVAENLNATIADETTFGQRLADRVASFGGSWTFILWFGGVIFVWITVNSVGFFFKPFDVYPFILLNLVLSCLAALQAPVIMMSQNRQESKDRLRSENDYRVNLKAELEIRHLHAKLDLLLTHQWQRLLEIQQVQTDLLEEIGKQKK